MSKAETEKSTWQITWQPYADLKTVGYLIEHLKPNGQQYKRRQFDPDFYTTKREAQTVVRTLNISGKWRIAPVKG